MNDQPRKRILNLIIVSLYVALYLFVVTWISIVFRVPQSLLWLWAVLFIVFGLEILSRMGAYSQETFLARIILLSLKDRLIFFVSFFTSLVVVSYFGYLFDANLSEEFAVIYLAALMIVLVTVPAWLFGSSDLKNILFKGRNKK